MEESKYKSLRMVVLEYDISRNMLYAFHKSGKITLKKLGGRTFVSISELDALMTDLERV